MRGIFNQFWRRRLLPGLLLPCAGLVNAQANETTFYGTLTSDYVFRGISNSDENGALQLGIDVSTDIGFFAGAWASTTDITTGNRNRSREVDYYVGYVRYFENDWSASVSMNRYTYPGGTGNVDYDYNELTAIFGYADRYWFEFDYTDSIFGHDTAAHNVEFLANWSLTSEYSLATAVGYFDVSDFAGRAYAHWQIGLSRSFAWATLDLRFHDTDDAPSQISAGGLADPRIVMSVSAAF